MRIVEAYQSYKPGLNVTALVSHMITSVPPKYLAGLDCVVLTNEPSLSKREHLPQMRSSRRRKHTDLVVFGRYHAKSRSSAPYIELRIDKILTGCRGPIFWIPLMRDMAIGHVLFHEIGHHIHRTHRPEYAEKENVANKWAGKLNINFVRKKYWYAMFLIVPALRAYRFMRRKHGI